MTEMMEPLGTGEGKNSALSEFLFGTLSTREGRMRRARMARMGFHHDSVLAPVDPRPGEPVTISVRAGAEIALQAATLYYKVDGTLPQAAPDLGDPAIHVVPMERAGIEWDTLQWSYLEEWIAEIPGQAPGTHVQYLIGGLTNRDQVIYSPHYDTGAREFSQNRADYPSELHRLGRWDDRPQVYGFYVDEECIPAWFREAVIYQIFVDRFAPDPGARFATSEDRGGFYGGTLRGILSRLDYLQALGVNCLWLSPIFPSPSHHGYDPTDYSTVEPRLGTLDDFQALLDEAHRRGMRVILDFVANHLSRQHPAFVAAQRDRTSPTYSWFRFAEWPGLYDSFFDLPDLPRLDSDALALRDYLTGSAKAWLARGVDGFRLDHAHGSTHAFWSVFRTATRAVASESVTFGEITETPSFIRSFAGRMDGCLDFRLLELLRSFFAFGTLRVSEFDKVLRQHSDYFGDSLVLPSFLDNHDMNRFLWVVDGDTRRLRLAALCQFTLPGPPIIYYGTEVGLSQLQAVGRLEEARLPMPWDENQDRALLAYYRDLVGLRRDGQASWRLPRQTLIADDEGGVYAYACGPYAIVLNNSSRGTAVSLSEWREAELVLVTERTVSLQSQEDQLYLPPFAGAVCRLNLR